LNKEQALKQKYQSLVNQYHGDLFRYAYWLTGDKHTAEDILQETFLRAWRAIDQLNETQAAKSWLITILRRENARRFERKQFHLVDIDTVQVVDESNDNESTQQHRQLHRAITMLATEYREPLMLQIIAGFSGEEIASLLNLNKNTVMTRLFRAKKQLTLIMNSDPTEALDDTL
jgi:RNA polymerase sigma-70 factor (ECF subfamily)